FFMRPAFYSSYVTTFSPAGQVPDQLQCRIVGVPDKEHEVRAERQIQRIDQHSQQSNQIFFAASFSLSYYL
ncbi:MAG: hypothetical protein II930_05515, partial [Lachnospiraceae bacterium]|nr:hypothetical protein [Lachnospiraceae bacterium]